MIIVRYIACIIYIYIYTHFNNNDNNDILLNILYTYIKLYNSINVLYNSNKLLYIYYIIQ